MTPTADSIDLRALQNVFPDPRNAPAEGLLAVGGNYRPEMLLAAYASGVFPWPSDELPHSWFSPDPRWVVRPADLRISRSLRKAVRRGAFHITFDHAFERVIELCSKTSRAGQDSTWITAEIYQGYCDLHHMGWAHSVESWHEGELVGGLYGVAVGGMFSGDSMFYLRPDASKVALVALAQHLAEQGFTFLDCQVHTANMERFGAFEISRRRFLEELDRALDLPSKPGRWSR